MKWGRLGDACMIVALSPIAIIIGAIVLAIPTLVLIGSLMILGVDVSWIEPTLKSAWAAIPQATKDGVVLIYFGLAIPGFTRLVVHT